MKSYAEATATDVSLVMSAIAASKVASFLPGAERVFESVRDAAKPKRRLAGPDAKFQIFPCFLYAISREQHGHGALRPGHIRAQVLAHRRERKFTVLFLEEDSSAGQ